MKLFYFNPQKKVLINQNVDIYLYIFPNNKNSARNQMIHNFVRYYNMHFSRLNKHLS